jgi:ribokinase
MPVQGETLTGSGFEIGFGGKGANQAIMAARLGARVTVVTRLGRDVFGDAYLRHLRQEGVDTRFVTIDPERHSGIALILVDEPTGLNAIAYLPGANGAVSPADGRAAREPIEAADVLLCQLEVPLEAVLEAFRIASAGSGGPVTVLNVAPVPVPPEPLPEELLRLADILVANELEASYLSGTDARTRDDALTAATLLADRWSCAAIVTLGAGGVAWAEPGGSARHIAAPEVRAVDTTGAGDAFVGSLGYVVASGMPLDLAVERATAVATLTVLEHGAQSSFPDRALVRKRLGW